MIAILERARAGPSGSVTASSSGSLIRDIADFFEVEFVGTTLMIEVGRMWKPALQGVFGLRP